MLTNKLLHFYFLIIAAAFGVNSSFAAQLPQTEGQGTAENPYTVSDASLIGSTLGEEEESSEVYIYGYVYNVQDDYNAESGTASFVVAADALDENGILCDGAKFLKDRLWVAGDKQISAGDEVVVKGKLSKRAGGAVVIDGASLFSLNGKTNDFTGDGTKENPFLVSDLRKMTEEDYPENSVWVRGFIVGSVKSASSLHDESSHVSTNIAIAGSASDVKFAPVQLNSGSTYRTKLNVVDNQDNIGLEVLLCGKIKNYFSVAGVQNLSDFEFVNSVATGFARTFVGAPSDSDVFSILGRKLRGDSKGLIIKAGKKLYVR